MFEGPASFLSLKSSLFLEHLLWGRQGKAIVQIHTETVVEPQGQWRKTLPIVACRMLVDISLLKRFVVLAAKT